MKRALAVLAALTISLPVLAHAEEQHDGREGRGGQHAQAPAPAQQNRAPAPQNRAPAPQQNQAGPRAGGFFGRVDPNAARQAAPNAAQERGRGAPNAAQVAPSPSGTRPDVARERGRGAPNAAQVAPRQGRPDANVVENRDRDFRDGRRDDRGDFRNDRRDDRRDFRGERDRGRFFNFRGRQYSAVRGSAFSYPRGWDYRHWDRGQFLPSVFLATPYYFDYGLLGLPPPPPGARWVRNGPDALLVNVYNDRILDVIYDAFY
ncbi:MAG TPA: RcnB family protein [Micropepsaceae bacterium]